MDSILNTVSDMAYVEDALFIIVGATAVLALIAAFARFISPIYNKFKQNFEWQEEFREAWNGIPETKHRASVPGVLERLNKIDGELKHTSDASLKDLVIKVSDSLATLSAQVDRMEDRQKEMLTSIGKNYESGKSAYIIGNSNNQILVDALRKNGIDVPPLGEFRLGDNE